MAEKDDILEEAREEYALCESAWSNAKTDYEQDYRFARLSEQWPVDIQQQRKDESRPALTINRLPAFIRQVVNEGRQNRPSIKVRPVNSGADQETAEVMGGIIRHIEAISDADIAYDTALDNACSGGFGFVGVDVDYTCDDTFDKDIKIIPFPNPMAVSWDPHSTAEDSSDWNYAFFEDDMPFEDFKKKFPKAEHDVGSFGDGPNISSWFNENRVRIAKYYKRAEVDRKILLLTDGQVVDAEKASDPEFVALMQTGGVGVAQERSVKSYEVTIRLINGVEVLEESTWGGSTIPIVPCWGETLNMKGERYFRSLIHNSKDAQRIFNYSRSTATEMVSLAPKAPFLGEQGAFDADVDKWNSINTKSWPYVEYKKGTQPPQRQPFVGVPEGAMSEAAASLEDMKQIIGISDPALGMPDGRMISGVAKRMERMESDTSTYHLIDNQHRMIRSVGRILLEMIPQVYTPGRIVRIIGQDGKPKNIQVGGVQK